MKFKNKHGALIGHVQHLKNLDVLHPEDLSVLINFHPNDSYSSTMRSNCCKQTQFLRAEDLRVPKKSRQGLS